MSPATSMTSATVTPNTMAKESAITSVVSSKVPAESGKTLTGKTLNKTPTRAAAVHPSIISKKDTISSISTNTSISKEQRKKDGDTTARQIEDDDDEDSLSEDIVVMETAENAFIVNEVTLAKIARMGTRRHLWRSKFGSYFVILAFLAGYDTMNGFAFCIDKYGVTFCIIYCVVMLLIGFPLFYMELCLGQFTSSNAYHVFSRMAPAMSGIGFISIIYNFMMMATDLMIIPYFMDLFMHTINIFTSAMPWHSCSSAINDMRCRELSHTCDNLQTNFKDLHQEVVGELGLQYSAIGNICYKSRLQIDRMDEYANWNLKDLARIRFDKWFSGESLAQHLFWNLELTESDARYLTLPSADFVVSMIIAWAIVFLVCHTGRRFISNLARITFIYTVAVLITFVIVFLSVKPSEYPYLGATQVSFNEVFKNSQNFFEMFISAAIVTLRLGQGGVVYLGSQYPFHNAPAKDCFFIIMAACILPFVYSLCHLVAVDSYILGLVDGDMENWLMASNRANNIYFYGSGHRIMHFVLFMQSLRILEGYESMMIFLISLMGLLITLVNKVVRVEIIISTVIESFPIFADYIGKRALLLLIIASTFIFTFVFVSQDGMSMLIGIEVFTYPLLSSVIVLAELFTVVWCYGGRRLMADIMAMNNRRNQEQESQVAILFSKYLSVFMWAFVIPSTICVCLIGKTLIGFQSVITLDVSDANVSIAIALISVIPIIAIIKVLNQYRNSNNVLPCFSPDPDLWGPTTYDNRVLAGRLEKKMRI